MHTRSRLRRAVHEEALARIRRKQLRHRQRHIEVALGEYAADAQRLADLAVRDSDLRYQGKDRSADPAARRDGPLYDRVRLLFGCGREDRADG